MRNHCVSPLTFSNMTPVCVVEPAMPAPEICSRVAQPSQQMQRIIDAQGAPVCHAGLGVLTADVLAPNHGVVSGIDCLQLNRLARTAGAPIDKGAGIKVFKKIGDRVEQGEPLYRIYAFDRSEYDLAVGATRVNTGYVIDGDRLPQGGRKP